MKRMVFIIMILSMLVLSQEKIDVHADPKPEGVSNCSITKSDYMITFEDVPLISLKLIKILDCLKDDIKEINFILDAGVDVFTIGYYKGEENTDTSYMLNKIISATNELKNDILEDENLSNDNLVEIHNLQLRTITVSCDTDLIEERLSELSDITNSYILKRKGYLGSDSETNVIEKELEKKGNRTYTINGSYHLQIPYPLFGYYVMWHNQLLNLDTQCSISLVSPHLGDGNNRYDSGYQWFPDQLGVLFTEDQSPNVNRTKLWYKYTQASLSNLNVDSNEAIELEVVYYNYFNASNSGYKGNAFQLSSGATYVTNQPNSYLDTNFGDSEYEVSFCVGVYDTSALSSNTYYYWQIDSLKGIKSNNYPNDGRFKVLAQRSYNVLGSGAFSVFAEEHEPIKKLGVPLGLSWVPATQSAWVYAAGGAGGFFSFNSTTSPIQ